MYVKRIRHPYGEIDTISFHFWVLAMIIIFYLLTGVIAGLVAGLFGLGGGAIIVPILISVFALLGFDPQWATHVAIGTSMATILFTSVAAIWVHHQKKAIIWKLVILISIGVSVGTWLGVKVLTDIPAQWLQALFSVFLGYISFTMWKKSKAFHAKQAISEAPNIKIRTISLHTPVGVLIGFVSSLFGIGGGSLTVPYLSKSGFSIKQAVAVSSVCGWFIALFASFSFLMVDDTGWQYSTGWIYWPAMLSIVLTSLIFARIGAKLAHRLTSPLLTKWFAVLLCLLSVKMAATVLFTLTT